METQEEPMYFDQTTRHIGSIQKNMIFSQADNSLLPGGKGKGAATRYMMGLGAKDTLPNYSVINGHQEATYKQVYGGEG